MLIYLLRYLIGMELRMTTSARLKSCLYSFTSPGGPMYPTRAVRHAAWDALDLLFPVSFYLFIYYYYFYPFPIAITSRHLHYLRSSNLDLS